MSSIRNARAAEGKFVQIANAAARDRRLSLKARGIILLVLSLPPDHTFSAAWLETQVPEGREAVRSGLRELERYGYYRRTKTKDSAGRWVWDQVIGDAALTEGDESESTMCGKPASGKPSDGKPSDKELKTEPPKTVKAKDEVQEMAQERASRRAHSSGASANWTVDRVVQDVREAIAQVHGDREAEDLSDGELLGFFYAYVKQARPRDLVAYVAKIIGDGPYLDTFMANVEAVCIPCMHWESECACPAAA